MFKKILSITGIIILLGLYISTLILALTQDSNFMNLLMASIVCTVAIPGLIHLLLMMKNARDGKNVYDNIYSHEKDSDFSK